MLDFFVSIIYLRVGAFAYIFAFAQRRMLEKRCLFALFHKILLAWFFPLKSSKLYNIWIYTKEMTTQYIIVPVYSAVQQPILDFQFILVIYRLFFSS